MTALCDRREDIPVLATHFLNQLVERHRKPLNGFASEAMEVLVKSTWPGNVCELYNVVEQAARLAKRNRTEFYKLLQRHHLDPKLFKAM